MSDDGFLSRWSRRKAQVQRGEAPPPEPQPALPIPPVPVAPASTAAPAHSIAAPAPAEPAESPPTLADVETLTPQADFSRFVKPDVEPGVQQAALKKLFADPHFNTMDGLDVYIDDYNTPDPLPASMLRQMVQSRLLGLFDEAPAEPAAPASSSETPPPSALPIANAPNENPDLRLQPHDAAGRAQPEPGAGPDAGREP